MASLERIRVHPIKALDSIDRDRVGITDVGGLVGDRAYAICDRDGEYVNGKRTAAVHRLRSDVDPDTSSVTIGVRGSDEVAQFHLDRERGALAEWLSAYFGYDVVVERAPGGELTDSRVLGGDVAGATVVSTATLETVASWFQDVDGDTDVDASIDDPVTVESVRRRFRANLEIAGVEPFWEDRLVAGAEAGSGDGGVRFRVGEVDFRGVKPVSRCVVPTRDPDTGEPTPGFRERFLERRAEEFPAWADADAFDQLYALTVLAHPAPGASGGTIERGDPIEILD